MNSPQNTHIHLFNDKKYRLYKPKEQEPKVDPDAKGLRPDVMLYERRHLTHSCFHFLIFRCFGWRAVSAARLFLPLQMQLLDGPERLIIAGRLRRKATICVS